MNQLGSNIRIRRFCTQAFLMLISFAENCDAKGFHLILNDGRLYGPGKNGEHSLQPGVVREFIVTGELAGAVEMVNNAAAAPNILAEQLHVGEVDGALSDGTLINENVDAGIVLEILESESGEKVKLLVCSISRETVYLDEKGNLVFSLTAGFDPGLSDLVVTMPISFVTGVAEVPISEKTKRGLAGGNDHAGPYPAGYQRIGRLGDYNNDGLLDGEFVLGGIAPFDLILAEGDPILIVRPFSSNIPVTAIQAARYTINGIIANFPGVISQAIQDRSSTAVHRHTEDLASRLMVAKANLARIGVTPSLSRKIPGQALVSRHDIQINEALRLASILKENVEKRQFGAATKVLDQLHAALLAVGENL